MDPILLRLGPGRSVDLRKPAPGVIGIGDIARSLSKICRFVGHVPRFYSVAQHSVIVALALPARLQLTGLLHDADESLFNDLSSRLKHSRELDGYRKLAQPWQQAIYETFGVVPTAEEATFIHLVDHEVGEVEVQTLVERRRYTPKKVLGYSIPSRIVPVGPHDAERLFLATYRRLLKGRYGISAAKR